MGRAESSCGVCPRLLWGASAERRSAARKAQESECVTLKRIGFTLVEPVIFELSILEIELPSRFFQQVIVHSLVEFGQAETRMYL